MKQSISSHEASEFAPSLLHHLPVSRRSQVLRQVLQHQLPPWHCKAWWSSIVWLGLAVGYEYADHVKSKSVDQNKALHHDSSWWFNMIQQKMMKPFLQALPTCSSLPRCVVARDLWWQWPDATVAETHKHTSTRERTHTHTLTHTSTKDSKVTGSVKLQNSNSISMQGSQVCIFLRRNQANIIAFRKQYCRGNLRYIVMAELFRAVNISITWQGLRPC